MYSKLARERDSGALEYTRKQQEIADEQHLRIVMAESLCPICGSSSTIPYGVARADLSRLRSARGVALGAKLAHVENVDGPANVIDLGGGAQAIMYRARAAALDLLFSNGRLTAIDSYGD